MSREFRLPPVLALLLFLLSPAWLHAQNAQVVPPATIIGEVRVARVGMPTKRLLITIFTRGATFNSTYTDDEGKFSFSQLEGNRYTIGVDDPDYEPAQASVAVNPDIQSLYHVFLRLTPREREPTAGPPAGANRNVVSSKDYTRLFPKKAVQEFDEGVKADGKQEHERAIEHYEKALKLAPEYYPARNNLGSDLLARGEFQRAKDEFERVIKLNQTDAAAYFNLANVYLLTRDYAAALRYASEGLAKQPDLAFGNFVAGSVQCRSGNAGTGEQLLLRALQLDPTLTKAHLELVNVYLQQHRQADAIARLELFLKVSPNDALGPKVRDLLKRLRAQAPRPQ